MSLYTLNLNGFQHQPFDVVAKNFRYKITEKSYANFDLFAYDFFYKAYNYYNFLAGFTTKRQFDHLFIKIFNPEFLQPDIETIQEISHALHYPARATRSAREKVLIAFSICINAHQLAPQTVSFPLNSLYLQNISEREINTLFYFIVNQLHEKTESSDQVMFLAMAKGAYSISFNRYFPDSQYIGKTLELRKAFADEASSASPHLYDLQTAYLFDKEIFNETIALCKHLKWQLKTFIIPNKEIY